MTKAILPEENIRLNAHFSSQEEAIRAAGEILQEGGYVDEAYIAKMFEREEITSTFMGNYVAIPHGTDDAKSSVHASGLSVLQVPDGVPYGDGNTAKLIFGIAGKDGEHLEILSKIAILCSEEANIEKMLQASTKAELLDMFSEVES
ncbi:PTS sugar transporter subunit IIA [Alkalicoccus urumqiensis]|uniref:Mannitol-specific phosphotransferase enzyme IIA component n=1 Tax=Alkalicoccus urumqiensis TaxID=1548213 RepID=A0A2P6MLL3_ALKUR|nr:PTS sugar transporter subunit IIA [Alkalicoccus urumqiensis]PRO67153.1 PTS mannitol transporter subunit IIA [Alkalicoccus urumqiensis]